MRATFGVLHWSSSAGLADLGFQDAEIKCHLAPPWASAGVIKEISDIRSGYTPGRGAGTWPTPQEERRIAIGLAASTSNCRPPAALELGEFGAQLQGRADIGPGRRGVAPAIPVAPGILAGA